MKFFYLLLFNQLHALYRPIIFNFATLVIYLHMVTLYLI